MNIRSHQKLSRFAALGVAGASMLALSLGVAAPATASVPSAPSVDMVASTVQSQSNSVQSKATAKTVSTKKNNKVDGKTLKKTQRKLKKLGFASVVVSGEDSKEFRNILCSWREAVDKKTTRGRLLQGESERILGAEKLPRPAKHYVTGLNVNRECQTVALVAKKENRKGRVFERIFRASTGAAGYETSSGTHVIQRRIDGYHNSTSYPSPSGWNMYRPSYFTSWGEAFHGSPSDSAVAWHPTSHGCVRMLQKDTDYLWANGGNSIGTKVYVYGTWSW